jgi:hypothetical protein
MAVVVALPAAKRQPLSVRRQELPRLGHPPPTWPRRAINLAPPCHQPGPAGARQLGSQAATVCSPICPAARTRPPRSDLAAVVGVGAPKRQLLSARHKRHKRHKRHNGTTATAQRPPHNGTTATGKPANRPNVPTSQRPTAHRPPAAQRRTARPTAQRHNDANGGATSRLRPLL